MKANANNKRTIYLGIAVTHVPAFVVNNWTVVDWDSLISFLLMHIWKGRSSIDDFSCFVRGVLIVEYVLISEWLSVLGFEV